MRRESWLRSWIFRSEMRLAWPATNVAIDTMSASAATSTLGSRYHLRLCLAASTWRRSTSSSVTATRRRNVSSSALSASSDWPGCPTSSVISATGRLLQGARLSASYHRQARGLLSPTSRSTRHREAPNPVLGCAIRTLAAELRRTGRADQATTIKYTRWALLKNPPELTSDQRTTLAAIAKDNVAHCIGPTCSKNNSA